MAAQLFEPAGLFVLESARLRVAITPYGGRIMSIRAPDRDGRVAEVVLGFDDVARYADAGGSFGALLGRCANRINSGRFTLDGSVFELDRNEGGNTLHGGSAGFGKVVWQVAEATAERLVLTHVSADGDQGFPGALSVTAVYQLDGDALSLDFTATTTRPTPVNLSSHPYFNLAGNGDVLGHQVMIAADAYLPTDAGQIPTGEIRSVTGTPFDFRQPMAAGARIREPDSQLLTARGYDHCFVLRGDGITPVLALRACDPGCGRVLEVFTTQPGLQFYTGNNLNGSVVGRSGALRQSDGFACEAQGFPDAINQPDFPSPVLRPGETYRATIIYRFGVRMEKRKMAQRSATHR